jgi:hypothetical protein
MTQYIIRFNNVYFILQLRSVMLSEGHIRIFCTLQKWLWCARAIKISRFFRDLILMDASIAGFIVKLAYERFCSSTCVFNILF